MQSICGTANIIGQSDREANTYEQLCRTIHQCLWKMRPQPWRLALGTAGVILPLTSSRRIWPWWNRRTWVCGAVQIPKSQDPSVQCWRTEPPCFNQFSELNRSRTENLWITRLCKTLDFWLTFLFEHVFFFKMIQLPCLFTARWHQIGQCR